MGDTKLLIAFPEGTEFLATGRCGDYLEVHFQEESGRTSTAYVPFKIGGKEILVPAAGRASTSAPGEQQAAVPEQAVAAVAAAAAAAAQPQPLPSPQQPFPCPSPQPSPWAASTAVPPLPGTSPSPYAPVTPAVGTPLLAGGGRLEVLEQRVAQQDNQILALQCELAELRRTLGAI